MKHEATVIEEKNPFLSPDIKRIYESINKKQISLDGFSLKRKIS